MSSTPNLAGNIESQAPIFIWRNKVLPALFAAGLGLMLVYITGFAETPALHNAAHDGRHSAAFPCH